MSSPDAAFAEGGRPARMSETLKRDRVTKPDGRYLIYYSWPAKASLSRRPDDTAARASRAPRV